MRIYYSLFYRLVIILGFYSVAVFGQNAPPAPKVLETKNVSRSSFIADWESVEGVFLYAIDVSNRRDFNSSIEGIVEGESYESLNSVYVVGISEVDISGLETAVYYYRVRAISLGGGSGNSAIKRVSLFREAIGFSES